MVKLTLSLYGQNIAEKGFLKGKCDIVSIHDTLIAMFSKTIFFIFKCSSKNKGRHAFQAYTDIKCA